MVSQSEVALQEQLINEQLKKLNAAEKNFIPFVRHVWPEFISGFHHKKIAKKFEDIKSGKIKRLIVICHLDIQSLSLLLSYSHRGSWAIIQN